jgi:hypothetical protein
MRSSRRRAIALSAAVLLLSGCGRRMHVVEEAFQWEDVLPAGSTVHVRTTNGRVEVSPSHENAVRIAGSKRWRSGRERDVQFISTRSGNDVYVCAVWGRGRCDERGYQSKGRSFSILRIFSLFNRKASDMVADIEVSLPPGVKIDAGTSNGAIEIEGAAAGVEARSVNGPIKVREVSGPVSVSTVNGSVSAELDSISSEDPLRFETVNGMVKVHLPAYLDGAVQLSTVNGSVSSEFPITVSGVVNRHQIRGQIGASSRPIVLKTVNGSVQLLKGSGDEANDDADADDDPDPDAPVDGAASAAPPAPPAPAVGSAAPTPGTPLTPAPGRRRALKAQRKR